MQYYKMGIVCTSSKVSPGKTPVWNAFTLISFPGSIMMLEIRKAMENSKSDLIGSFTLLTHCSESIEVNYYTRLNPK